MQLFLSLNDLAGRWPLLDEVARVFYVGALPALGTLLLAQMLLFPRSRWGASRSKTAFALLLAFGLGALLVWGFDWLAAQLHLGVLSPRPWMTRRVNWLVVEPQDNSFPCIEVVLATVLAGASWRLNRKLGTSSAVIVILFALVRMFCGNNYLADVLVGIALGAGSFALCAVVCERHSSRGLRVRALGLGALPLIVTIGSCYCFALATPRFGSKLGVGQAASAAPSASVSTVSSVNQGEGEGMAPEEGRAEELALAKRSTLFLPQVESFLRGKLTPIARPFRLLDVEAAPVKAGTSSFRCAAIRFEVPVGGSQTRRLVGDRAARLVQTAFALDSHLQNVDIIAVARDEGRNLDGSQMLFAGDEVPVFTASVQRKNLLVASPAWLNAPGVDGGSWLRARSRIYINTRALPYSPPPRPTPQLTPSATIRAPRNSASAQPTTNPSPITTSVSAPPTPRSTAAGIIGQGALQPKAGFISSAPSSVTPGSKLSSNPTPASSPGRPITTPTIHHD